MAYDPKCHELAEYFLREEIQFPYGEGEVDAAKVAALAQDIQDAVENFFEHEIGNTLAESLNLGVGSRGVVE